MTSQEPLTVPEGGRIHTLTVQTTLDREWQKAVNAAGPDTPDSFNVRKVRDLYLPRGSGEVEEEIILVNFGQGGSGSWDRALSWVEEHNLKVTDPRRVFAIGEEHPNFHREVGINPTYVVATEKCYFEGVRQACCVRWLDSDRWATLDWLDAFGSSVGWFAFRK